MLTTKIVFINNTSTVLWQLQHAIKCRLTLALCAAPQRIWKSSRSDSDSVRYANSKKIFSCIIRVTFKINIYLFSQLSSFNTNKLVNAAFSQDQMKIIVLEITELLNCALRIRCRSVVVSLGLGGKGPLRIGA